VTSVKFFSSLLFLLLSFLLGEFNLTLFLSLFPFLSRAEIKKILQIRFTRLGRKRQAFYRLVAIDSKKRRDGLPIEFLGWYDPIKKESSLNAPAIKEWIAKGAQPSETAGSLLKKALIIS
jgi:ribosomal protein S16